MLQNSDHNPQKNNLIPLLITGLLVALGVSGGFILTQQKAQTQAKLEAMEKDKEEAEAKLVEEQQKREQEEAKRQESDKMRLEAEQARVKAEDLRRQAEIKAKSQTEVRTIVVDPSSIGNSYNSSSSSPSSSSSLNEITAYIQYENDYETALELKSYLQSFGVNFPTDIEKKDSIKVNDIRYSNSSDINLAYQIKTEIESFYNQKNINTNFVLKDLSSRGFNTSSGKIEIWINK